MKNLSTRSLASKLATLLVLASPSLALPQDGESPQPRTSLSHYNLEKGVALSGYDPVSYFREGGAKPTEGRDSISAAHRGVTYRFANQANRERFLASPERFEPAYGGWCAYAMTGGDKVEVDPESFLIDDGQLLVFYKGFFNDTRKKWEKEGSKKLRPEANGSWKRISGEDTGRDVSHFNLKDGLALAGYDPTSYASKQPALGKATYTASFQGVEYRFASKAARESFLKDPSRNEPQFGGWCAWAMAGGKKVPVDPDAFVRDEEGLFLFYNKDKRDEWLADRANMTRSGTRHWARITADV